MAAQKRDPAPDVPNVVRYRDRIRVGDRRDAAEHAALVDTERRDPALGERLGQHP